MGAKQLEAADRTFRWLRYQGGPLHGRTAVVAWHTDEEVPERLTATAAPHHYERDPRTHFMVRVDDGERTSHRYQLTSDTLVLAEREVEEEQKREVEEQDEETGKKVKRTVTELVTRKVVVTVRGGYRYVGPGAWPTEEVAMTVQDGER